MSFPEEGVSVGGGGGIYTCLQECGVSVRLRLLWRATDLDKPY